MSREKAFRPRPITPPELYYRSPELTNKFYAAIPKWIYPSHICAASMDAIAYGLLKQRYGNLQSDPENIQIISSLQELKKAQEYAAATDIPFPLPKLIPFEKCQKVYEAITLFKAQ